MKECIVPLSLSLSLSCSSSHSSSVFPSITFTLSLHGRSERRCDLPTDSSEHTRTHKHKQTEPSQFQAWIEAVFQRRGDIRGHLTPSHGFSIRSAEPFLFIFLLCNSTTVVLQLLSISFNPIKSVLILTTRLELPF